MSSSRFWFLICSFALGVCTPAYSDGVQQGQEKACGARRVNDSSSSTNESDGDLGLDSGRGNITGGDDLPPVSARSMGNITPYRKDMLLRLRKHWRADRNHSFGTIQIDIARSGVVISSRVIESCGSLTVDKEVLNLFKKTVFMPLPDWYKGQFITFKIDTSKIAAQSGSEAAAIKDLPWPSPGIVDSPSAKNSNFGDERPKLGIACGKGNIAPYRQEMILRIRKNWPLKTHCANGTVQVEVLKSGDVASAEIIESSGNRAADASVLSLIKKTVFMPLPDWYKGDSLSFKFDLGKFASK